MKLKFSFRFYLLDRFLSLSALAFGQVGDRNLSQQSKRPLNYIQKAVNKEVSVRLKMDLEYRGKMTNVDPYMNVILVDATEYSGGNPSATYGKVVIRGNNVLFIKVVNDLTV